MMKLWLWEVVNERTGCIKADHFLTNVQYNDETDLEYFFRLLLQG
jgi:hypothetical protein